MSVAYPTLSLSYPPSGRGLKQRILFPSLLSRMKCNEWYCFISHVRFGLLCVCVCLMVIVATEHVQIECKGCHRRTYMFQEFTELPLTAGNNASLESAMRKFLSADSVKRRCATCKNTIKTSKITSTIYVVRVWGVAYFA